MNNNEIYFAKVKSTAIIPSKREEDGGYDIYSNFEEDYIAIRPHETVMIPTGIASAFSSDYVMILKERGSTGTKGIAQRCGVIDSGFRNEWKVPVTNTTNQYIIITKIDSQEVIKQMDESKKYFDLFIIKKNDTYITTYITTGITFYPYTKAIAQALLLPVPKVTINELTYDDLKNISSERGLGMLGSSLK